MRGFSRWTSLRVVGGGWWVGGAEWRGQGMQGGGSSEGPGSCYCLCQAEEAPAAVPPQPGGRF